MKTTIKGNVVSLVSDINVAEYNRFAKMGAVIVTDEKENQVYRITRTKENDRANLSRHGATFNAVINDKLALVFVLQDSTADEFIEGATPALILLQKYEPIIVSQLTELAAQFTAVKASIEIED